MLATSALGGPYSLPASDPGNAFDAPIARADPRIIGFEKRVEEFKPAPSAGAPFNDPWSGLASLGDLSTSQIASGAAPGSITLGFTPAIRDGAGPDFAAFENGFSFGGPTGVYMELAHVEVSSDGANFARFPSISLNSAPLPGGFGSAFSGYDSTNVYNLAGKHAEGWGTPFDLSQLSAHPLVTGGLLDLEQVRYVRLVDVAGNGSDKDSQGQGILDNWLTSGASSGFDYLGLPTGAIGVIHAVPSPFGLSALALGCAVCTRRRRRE